MSCVILNKMRWCVHSLQLLLTLRQRRKQQEEEEKRLWDEQALNIMTAQERLVEDQEHQKRDKARQSALENLKKAEEDKEREKYRNNELYTNRPTKDFFDQFNTSSR